MIDDLATIGARKNAHDQAHLFLKRLATLRSTTKNDDPRLELSRGGLQDPRSRLPARGHSGRLRGRIGRTPGTDRRSRWILDLHAAQASVICSPATVQGTSVSAGQSLFAKKRRQNPEQSGFCYWRVDISDTLLIHLGLLRLHTPFLCLRAKDVSMLLSQKPWTRS